MSELPAALYHLRPKPFILDHDKAAGSTVEGRGDSFRSCVVLPRSNLWIYTTAKRWNLPGTPFYSCIPSPLVGEPFDNSKPRKGRWGETVGSKSWYDSLLFGETWDNMEVSQKDREEIALDAARNDLQRRIDICLYGSPRHPEIQLHPCRLGRS